MFKTIRRWMEPEPGPEAQWFAGRFAYCDTCIEESRSHLRFAAGDIAVHERDFGHAFEPLAERWEALALEVASARARWPGNRNRMTAILGETNEALHAFSDGDYAAARGESLQVAATAMRFHWEGDAQEQEAEDVLLMRAALHDAVTVLAAIRSGNMGFETDAIHRAWARGHEVLERAYRDDDGEHLRGHNGWR